MKKYYSIYAAAAVLLLTACTQDFLQDGEGVKDNDGTISFSAQTVDIQDETRSTAAPEALPLTGDGLHLWLMPSETPMVSDATRGTQINSVESLNNFGVSAYRHGAIPAEKTLNEYLTDNNLKPDFFYNLEATKITDTQKFKLTKDFFWPTDDDVLSFFAYAPYGDENVELSAATVDGPQSINFKVDTDVKKQVDLITAQASTKSHLNTSVAPSVALNFTHQLTGIRFVIGDQFLKGWVKSISLKGVYTQGKYTIGSGWTLDDTKKGNFTISYNLDKPVAGTPGEEVSASDEVFMMIPHTFAEDDAATIEVVYNDKYTDYVVSAPLKGQTWKAGKTVTYAITSNKLTTLRIGQIQFATTPEGAPKRIWAAGDKIGMYVVSADGKKLKHKNVPVTFDGANWNIDHTTAEGTIYKLPGESFYFYYPYSNVSNGQPTGYPEQCPELKATAPVFFEGVRDYFAEKTDQSTLANYTASDLQVARAEDDGRASMVKATMERQVGMVKIQLRSVNLPVWKYLSTDANYSWNHGTYENHTASNAFQTYIPYGGNLTYFYLLNPRNKTSNKDSSASIMMSASGDNSWAATVEFTCGTVTNVSPVPNRTKVLQSYTLAAGDFLYNDGAIGHTKTTYSNTSYPNRTPVGLVYNVTSSKISATERNKGWTHGCAVAISYVPRPSTELSGFQWCIESVDQTNPTGSIDNGYPNYKADLDGYRKTQLIKHAGTSTQFPAAYAALNYTPQVTNVSNSGWYLPSAGQMLLVYMNLGGLKEEDIDQHLENDPTFFSWAESSTRPITYINATYSISMSTTGMWTSTETKNISPGSGNTLGICALYAYDTAMDDSGSQVGEKQMYKDVQPVISF